MYRLTHLLQDCLPLCLMYLCWMYSRFPSSFHCWRYDCRHQAAQSRLTRRTACCTSSSTAPLCSASTSTRLVPRRWWPAPHSSTAAAAPCLGALLCGSRRSGRRRARTRAVRRCDHRRQHLLLVLTLQRTGRAEASLSVHQRLAHKVRCTSRARNRRLLLAHCRRCRALAGRIDRRRSPRSRGTSPPPPPPACPRAACLAMTLPPPCSSHSPRSPCHTSRCVLIARAQSRYGKRCLRLAPLHFDHGSVLMPLAGEMC
jgi:hypothetical protein